MDIIFAYHVLTIKKFLSWYRLLRVASSPDPYLYFEIVSYSENDLWNVGGQFGLVPERKTFDFFMSHKQVHNLKYW